MLSELLVCWFIIKLKYFRAFWKDQYRERLSSYFKRGEIYKEILLFE